MINATHVSGAQAPEHCPIHVETHGHQQLPCAVLVLGLGMQIGEWPTHLLESLAESHFVICLDNRDMGRSGRCGPDRDQIAEAILTVDSNPGTVEPIYRLDDMADDVLGVLDRYAIGRFSIIGFSMGGMIAQLVAARAADRTEAFVQLCSSAGRFESPFSADTEARFQRMSNPDLGHHKLAGLLADDLAHFAAPQVISAAEAETLAADALAAGFTQGGFTRQLLAIMRGGDRTSELKKITARSLILGGAEDCCIDPVHSRHAHELVAGSTLKILEGQGHTINDQAVREIVSWVQQN